MDDIKIEITVRYSCHQCGIKDAEVPIAAREPGEALNGWMDRLGMALSKDHRRRSPWCHPDTLKDVQIPINGAQQIGGPASQ
jgi:hypothetical protein